MIFKEFATRAGKFVADNSPAILTAVGVVGTITTAVLTAKATFKAEEIIRYANKGERLGARDPIGLKEEVKLVWKLYIPAATTGTLTVASIILANRIGTRRAAALAAAYAISEKAFADYKDKVIEKIGEKKEQAVRDEIAQERVNKSPMSELVVIGQGSVICYDSFTGRYFLSDMETLRKAQNDINYQVNNNYYASLTDFYDLIGLPRTSISDEFGWNTDKLLELEFSTTLNVKNEPCLVINFRVEPIRGYSRLQ